MVATLKVVTGDISLWLKLIEKLLCPVLVRNIITLDLQVSDIRWQMQPLLVTLLWTNVQKHLHKSGKRGKYWNFHFLVFLIGTNDIASGDYSFILALTLPQTDEQMERI